VSRTAIGDVCFAAMKSLAVAVACLPSVASADAPRTITFEAALGGARSTMSAPAGTSRLESHSGLDATAGVGWFVTPRLAVNVRAIRTYAGPFTLDLVGPGVQYFWGPRIWVGANAGVDFARTRDGSDPGVGVAWRVGGHIPWTPRHLISVAIEARVVEPITHERGVLSAALLAGYQFL
jgi:hypothetical protein